MRLVDGSVEPPANIVYRGEQATLLVWHFEASPGGLPPMRYRLEPLEAGIWPTNNEARVSFRTSSGATSEELFPVPEVEVLVPPTPTAPATPTPPPTTEPTASATSSATPEPTNLPGETPVPSVTPLRPPTITPRAATPRPPEPLYLPAVYTPPDCVPTNQAVDLALVIDSSSSMTGGKLLAAAEAGRTLIHLLALGRDQAAVVTFDQHARVLQPLTADAQALDRALDGLVPGVGTRIDLGLREGVRLVAGPDSRAAADPVIVLLTDGRPDVGSLGELELVASLAREIGVALYVVGLGADVDVPTLQMIAGRADRVYLAPNATDLRDIYTAVAIEIPCR
jgi:uncharacterized protein YegL